MHCREFPLFLQQQQMPRTQHTRNAGRSLFGSNGQDSGQDRRLVVDVDVVACATLLLLLELRTTMHAWLAPLRLVVVVVVVEDGGTAIVDDEGSAVVAIRLYAESPFPVGCAPGPRVD